MYRLKSIKLYFFSIINLFFLSFRKFYFKSNYYNKKLITYAPERFFYNPSTYLSTSLTTISNDFFKIKNTAPDLLWKIKSENKMLYIKETIGHGTNIINGDYSVGASGMKNENGEFSYPVSEITIAGNLNNIFKNITLADDLEFNYATNSPTMMVEGMVVGGK